MVVEADFVPVVGLGELPLPFRPSATERKMAWLYSVGPVIYHAERQTRTFFGHNAGTVAYVIDSVVAADWLTLFEEEMTGNGQQYRPWEVTMPIRLRREHGVKCNIRYWMYGEHGGIADLEHKCNKVRAWHEADSLAGSLYFLPAYARGSRGKYFFRRVPGRLRGEYRPAMGKYFDSWPAWWCSGENRLRK